MKLRNKKTGQEGNFIINKDHFECVDLEYVPEYRNLAELNDEWEDYEEPKRYWYIDERLRIWSTVRKEDDEDETHFINILKSVGNYFETKEEAEKAVEKLKAWKRLEDKGFRFCGIDDDYIRFSIDISKVNSTEEEEELNKYGDLLFGGEE